MITARANRSRRYLSMRWLLLLAIVGWTSLPLSVRAASSLTDTDPADNLGLRSTRCAVALAVASPTCRVRLRAGPGDAPSGGGPHHRSRG